LPNDSNHDSSGDHHQFDHLTWNSVFHAEKTRKFWVCVIALACVLIVECTQSLRPTRSMPTATVAVLVVLHIGFNASLLWYINSVRPQYFLCLVTNHIFPKFMVLICLDAANYGEVQGGIRIVRSIVMRVTPLASVVCFNTHCEKRKVRSLLALFLVFMLQQTVKEMCLFITYLPSSTKSEANHSVLNLSAMLYLFDIFSMAFSKYASPSKNIFESEQPDMQSTGGRRRTLTLILQWHTRLMRNIVARRYLLLLVQTFCFPTRLRRTSGTSRSFVLGRRPSIRWRSTSCSIGSNTDKRAAMLAAREPNTRDQR